MSQSPRTHCAGADFCAELAGVPDTEFCRVYEGNPPSRIIGRSENLTLIADMSPLCAGHLLIVSNYHHLSFAEVVQEHEHEVENFSQETFYRYQETFGDPLVLEHGSAEGIGGSACITHAHWHVVPLGLEAVHSVMSDDGLGSIKLDDLGGLAAAGRGVPYFYCADRSLRRLYGVGQTMRRQYLRSVMGVLLGIPDPEWDYAVVVRKELLRITMAKTAGWRLRARLTPDG